MPSFHEVLFPEDISYGSSGGPAFNTTIIEMSSGVEQRNINWSEAKATYEANMGVKTREQMEELLDFFYARNGKGYGFRYKDWADYTLDRTQIGVLTNGTDGNTFQLFKRYEPMTDYFYDRPLRKIAPGTLKCWITHGFLNGGVPLLFNVPEHAPAGFSDYLDVNTGVLFIQNNDFPTDSIVEVSCEFHVPVRFDTDEMKINQDDWETMSWPSIPLVELKLR